jgi:DNA-binding CsgD family transcriptional regulator
MESVTITQKPTQQEKDLVLMIADGLTAGKISRVTGIGEAKLAKMLSETRLRFNCDNSASLVALFLRKKFIK